MDYTSKSRNFIKRDANAPNSHLDTFVPPISFTDSDHDSGCRTDSETNLKETRCGLAENLDSLDSVSSSSSISSSGGFFQVNPQLLTDHSMSSALPKLKGEIKPLYESHNVDVSNEVLFKLEESFKKSPGSTSQVSDVTHESFRANTSSMQSPPIQVMERPEDFNPNRIPPSVFALPSTPKEWSEVSNDSLFSIHIGNQVSMISGDLYRSGEISKSGEILEYGESYQSGKFYNSQGPITSNELITRFDHASAADKEVEPEKNSNVAKTMGAEKNLGATNFVYESTYKFLEAGTNNLYKESLEDTGNSYSANCQTGGSTVSNLSLTFPTKKPACPLCHYSTCNSTFCCCKWPSCCFKWPKCCQKCSGCSCKWFSFPGCLRNCVTLPGCGCKWFRYCCKWHCCNCKVACSRFHCKCPTWPSGHCKFLTCSSCSCKCPFCSSCCCKCPSLLSCFCKYSTRPSCKFHHSSCSLMFCYRWNGKPKRIADDRSCNLPDGKISFTKK